MPAVPVFHTQWLPTMVLTAGCLEALWKRGWRGQPGPSSLAWSQAHKGPLRERPTGHRTLQGASELQSDEKPRVAVVGTSLGEGLGMLLTQNLSLLRRMGEVPGIVLGAVRAKDMKTVAGGQRSSR